MHKSFVEWESEVNAILFSKYGVTLSDLPDMMTRDAYDDGVDPRDFVRDMDMEELVYG